MRWLLLFTAAIRIIILCNRCSAVSSRSSPGAPLRGASFLFENDFCGLTFVDVCK